MMREIYLSNSRLEKILYSITDVVYEPSNLKSILENTSKKEDNLITDIPSIDDSYLYEAKKQFKVEDYGFPRGACLCPLTESSAYPEKLIIRLQNTLGAQYKALAVVYPENGFIGWHHNGNAPGYNILFSYSSDGKGYFKYYDYLKDEIVYLHDKPGWNVKCGYYPDQHKEPNRVYWHAASTQSPRLSIAFVIPHREMWISMLEYITGGDYDQNYLKAQGTVEELKTEGYI